MMQMKRMSVAAVGFCGAKAIRATTTTKIYDIVVVPPPDQDGFGDYLFLVLVYSYWY